MKAPIFIALTLTACMATFLFHIKHDVLSADKQIRMMQRRLNETREHLMVLKAEWSYLANPARIQKLTRQYLPQTRPLDRSQIIPHSFDDY